MKRYLFSFPVNININPRNGRVSSKIYQWNQISGIEKYIDCDYLCILSNEGHDLPCMINLPRDKIIQLPVDTKTYRQAISFIKTYKHLKRLIKSRAYNGIFLFEPSFINFLILLIFSNRFRRHIYAYMLGDHINSTWILYKNTKVIPIKIKYLLKILFFKIYIHYVAKKSDIVFTDHPKILNKYSNAKLFMSTTISESDIQPVGRLDRTKKVFNIVSVSRVVPLKGIEILISAVIKLSKIHNIHLKIVGPVYGQYHDGYEYKLRSLIRQHNAESYIELVGNISERGRLNSYYEEADLFVVPSITEGIPKVIPEAMAHGLPIVATNVGGIPFLVEDNINGLLVEPGNQSDLEEKIERIILDHSLYAKLTNNALLRARTVTKESVFLNIKEKILE